MATIKTIADKAHNLRIWSQVEHTDPEITKEYKGRGGFEGTALNPTAMVRRATEIFGPIGIRWGYTIEEERYDTGAPINYDPVVVNAVVHTIRLRLWYKDEQDELHEVTHYGHTDFVFTTSYGIKTEPEPGKKSLTDALKKCLSMLGFSADVYMGKFDDDVYVEQQSNRVALEKADNQADEIARQKEEYQEWLANHRQLIITSISLYELEKLYTMVMRKLKARKDEKMMRIFTQLKDERKAILEKDDNVPV